MKKKLIVVVDMINGFVNIGALHDSYIAHIIPNIKTLIKENLEQKNDIICFRDCHSLEDEEFKTYPIHCLNNTEESELVEELKPFYESMIDIPKNITNGFENQQFKTFYQIHYNEYEEIIVVGCCTDICVKDFTISLLDFHKEHGINIPVTIPIDSVETFDGLNHDRKVSNEIGVELMRQAGANLVTTYRNEKRKELMKK